MRSVFIVYMRCISSIKFSVLIVGCIMSSSLTQAYYAGTFPAKRLSGSIVLFHDILFANAWK